MVVFITQLCIGKDCFKPTLFKNRNCFRTFVIEKEKLMYLIFIIAPTLSTVD